jgi:2'-hydroxyisoflavone reductase
MTRLAASPIGRTAPHRIARGGDVVAPGPPERAVQFIDVRDLGAWIVDLCEQRRTGTFKATRPGVSWGEMLATSQHSVGGEAPDRLAPRRFPP